MKFEKLGEKERKILLDALGFSILRLRCQCCEEKLNYNNCSIMPPVKTKLKATLLCGSILCYAEYFSELDEEKEKEREKV